MNKTARFLIVLFIPAFALARQVRTHYNVVHRDYTPAYVATIVLDVTPSRAHRTFLLHATNGTELVIDFDQNYSGGTTTATIEDPATHDRARVTSKLPFRSKTLNEVREEARAHPELANVPVPVTVHGNHGTDVTGDESDWTGPHRAAMHEQAKRAVGAALLASLARFQGLLGLPDFAPVCAHLTFIAQVAPCTRDTNVMMGVVEPDCAFDKRFGEACSADQLNRAGQKKRGAY